MNQDFYIGYSPKAPAELGRWVARLVTGLVLAGLVIGGLLTVAQAPFADSRFEYGIYHQYSGVIEEWPYPILRTAVSSFLLVAPGKHGLSGAVHGLQGKGVRLQGSLTKRWQDEMLEVPPESIHETMPLPIRTVSEVTNLGPVRLRGEIVDSKCYLGVMNPGNGKVHRDCAVRCISGGVPPAFIARDAAGKTMVILLVGSDGRALNKEVLSFVAEPMEIRGQLVRSGSNLILKSEPAAFLRSPE
ncbi:MAG TPA: hypothetical protein VKB79_01865 [Bryobacteraceae bacterium]|nr:hypothetical protein [Bryobacteraceae bacterium]